MLERLATAEARLGEHDRRLDEVRVDLQEATKAIWAAVEILRARPQVHPVAATIIGALTGTIGVLATLVVKGV